MIANVCSSLLLFGTLIAMGCNPPPSPELADAPRSHTRPATILYGASWCGACQMARSYLEKKGVAFIEKDIEEDSNAAWELRAKLARARIPLGSIPVLDVRGRLLVGFSELAIDQALDETR